MLNFLKKKKLFDQLIFNADFYRNQLADPNLQGKSIKALRKHFIAEGMPSGIAGSPIFDASFYLEKNEDVKKSAGTNFQKVIDHFLSKGRFENRRTSPHFDVNYYYNANPDLQKNIGRHYEALYTHYMQHGRHEKRLCDPNATPDSFMIELTNSCNLHCITCPREYKFGHEMDVGHMECSRLKRLLEEMLPLANSINLTGLGETFLYKNLPEVTDVITDYPKEVTTFLSTNAQTPNCLTMFEQIKGKVNLIQISIDGVKKTYERVRGKASFDLLTENVQKMAKMARETKTSLMFNVVAFPANYQTLPDIVRLAQEVGVQHVHVNSRNLVTIPEVDLAEYNFYKTETFVETVDKAKDLARSLGIGFSTFENKGFCDLVYNHFYITWDGYLVPCCAKPFPKELHFGNVFEGSLATCISNYQASGFRSAWDVGSVPQFCRRCHLLN